MLSSEDATIFFLKTPSKYSNLCFSLLPWTAQTATEELMFQNVNIYVTTGVTSVAPT